MTDSLADTLGKLLEREMADLLESLPPGLKKHEIHGEIHDWVYQKKIGSMAIDWKAHETYLVVRVCSYDIAGRYTECPRCMAIGVIFVDRDTPAERVVLCPECDGLTPRWREPSYRFKLEYPEHLLPKLVHDPLPEFEFDS